MHLFTSLGLAAGAAVATSAAVLQMNASETITSGIIPPTTTPHMPYIPPGGIGVNNTPPQYVAMSDFDWQSINLALNQEWIELDLFNYGLAKFSVQDFQDAGLYAEDRFLIEFMAQQEIGHALLLSNILGPYAAKPCTYRYPFNTVREFIDFCQKLTRFGESGVYGFIEHLDSRPAAQLLLQSITTEARQQMIFRQFLGLFPMPVWFETGITQSMAWTLLAPYLVSCPAENPRIAWQNFPALNVTNNPDATPYFNTSTAGNSTSPGITNNRSEPLSFGGRQVNFTWELPGTPIGYNDSYRTNTTAGPAKFVAWISQLNTTYTPLENVQGESGTTNQPDPRVFGNDTAPVINGTMFVALVDQEVNITPANISKLNSHIVAGPALYQADRKSVV